MPVASTLHEYAVHLHEQGALNLDTPLRALVGQQTLDAALPNDPAIPRLPTDIFVGPRYVFITALPLPPPPDLNQAASVADDVRASTGQQRPSPGTTRPALDQTFGALDGIGFINLDATLRSLIQPDGIGCTELDLRDAGPALYIHENFIFLHVSQQPPQLGDVFKTADSVRKVTGS